MNLESLLGSTWWCNFTPMNIVVTCIGYLLGFYAGLSVARSLNLESLLDLALAIGRVVLALVFIGCILTLLIQ